METPHSPQEQRLSGSIILRLTTLTSEHIQPADAATKNVLMQELVFGDGLKDVDQLLIDGVDAQSLLPRPDAYGNNRLALMALLDTLPASTLMAIQHDETPSPAVAAD